MEVNPSHEFPSVQDRAQYWERLALEYKQRYEETRDELEEFQQSSRELEEELEKQLEQLEKSYKELKSSNNSLQIENDILKERLQLMQKDSHRQISELQEELNKVKTHRDQLQKYIRELEQSNDDLERAKRATVVSLEDFESRLNMAIERNVFLENELDEKENMKTTVQRLKDEARDLRSELKTKKEIVMCSEPDNDRIIVEEKESIDSNKLVSQIDLTTPVKNHINHLNENSPLTPSTRISALNIVGDLLRKVGALESKLASCRNFVKETPRHSSANSPTSPLSPSRFVSDAINSPLTEFRNPYYKQFYA